jgi:hypothetical protein
MGEAVHIDPGMVARLRRQLASGERVASVGDLKDDLWRLAFPSEPIAELDSSLGDLYDVAVSRARNAVRDVFLQRLSVDPKRIPHRYAAWFSLPWYRHYTLNVDDLDEAVSSHFDLPRELLPLSAISDALPTSSHLLSIHLNGQLKFFPEGVTFSAPQYGRRLARNDIWYQTLAVDLLNHPVVFVGTVLEEPSLWQHLEFRQQRAPDSIELRPPSYLVSPNLPAARAALLKRYNIDWIQATEEEFFNVALKDAAAESDQGHSVLSRRFQPSGGSVLLRPLSGLRLEPGPENLSLFLLGREPSWADLTEGYAVERNFEPGLLKDSQSDGVAVTLITGTAGSGKSTTAMRLALALESTGRSVAVLNSLDSVRTVRRVVNAVRAQAPEVILIDDIDVFGDRAGRLIREIAEIRPAPLVVAAIRSSRLQGLDLAGELEDLNVLELTVPPLHDTDIDGLINALERANRLGLLAGMGYQQRRQVFKEQSGRQLLVAMYKATSGESLHDRVFSECEDLGGPSRLVYGMAAIATAERYSLLRDELVLGISLTTGIMDYAKLQVVPDLIKRDLLIADGIGLRLRHRWIAETSIECYQNNSVLGPSLKALVVALATKSDPQADNRVREKRLLRRLLNHDYLQRMTANVATIREIYDLVEDLLAWDYHYWLQRGSFEVETGDLSLAENFLNAAISRAPERDFRVRTEYAYLLLKKASNSPHAPSASEWADSALADLEQAMSERGTDDSYPFHVYGSQGLSWARRAPLAQAARITLVRRLMEAVDRGRELHPRKRDLSQLASDLKKEYLNIAVD